MEAMRIMLRGASENGALEEYREVVEYFYGILFYRNTLFSYMQGMKKKDIRFIENLGKEILAVFPDFRENPYFQKEVNDYRRTSNSNLSIYEIAEAILLKRMSHNLSIGLNNYSSATCHCLADLYEKLGNSREALKYYIGLLLLEINMTRFQCEEFYDSYIWSVKNTYHDESYEVLSPGITNFVFDNKHLIDDDLIYEAYESVKNCSKIYLKSSEFNNMIHDLIDSGKIDVKKYLKLIIERL